MIRGVFSVYKPRGLTSADVTNRIKKILLEDVVKGEGRKSLKVGHGGTLDKSAEGVLVIGIGEDCKRLANFLTGEKWYQATGEFGKATDTYDSEGTVTSIKPFDHITLHDLQTILRSFQGQILQTPPSFSALKKNGRRLSDLARQGMVLDIKPRHVVIHSITLDSLLLPFFTLSVHCSSGTYIRSLVHDIGSTVRSAAHVRALCRTRQGCTYSRLLRQPSLTIVVFCLLHVGPFVLADALKEDDWSLQKIIMAIEMFTPKLHD